MIPQKLHFIWLGGELPAKYAFFLNSWYKAHPQWEIKIWNDADAAAFPMKRRDVFAAAPNWGAKSDVFRYEILHALGGVYADTDFLCISPLDSLLNESFFCGLVSDERTEVNNAFVGSKAGHPILSELLQRLTVPAEGLSSEATFEATGPALFSNVVQAYRQQHPQDAAILPMAAFYPMPNTFSRTAEPPWKQYVTGQTYAVHFWEYSWQKRPLGERIRKALLKPFPPGFKKWIKGLLGRGKP